MSKFIREIRNSMVNTLPFVPFMISIILCVLIYNFLRNFHNKVYIHDDTEMFRMMEIKRIEDSLIRATGKGQIDTVDFERILNK
jgi:hypothetical protein